MDEWQQHHAFLISVFFRDVTDPRPRLQRALKSLPIERTENKSALIEKAHVLYETHDLRSTVNEHLHTLITILATLATMS